MSMAAFALVASEFMPVSLLTPIAQDLQVTEGMAGQGIAVSGLFALLTSLLIAAVAARFRRKPLLLWLTVLMIVSGTLVAFAPGYSWFMVGRALIGVAIGGFWSLSAATAMRLVPEAQVPRAGHRQRRQCAGHGYRGTAWCLPGQPDRLARSLPNAAEAGGGLMVAVVQLAISLGATVGGVVFDLQGYQGTFELSALVLLIGAGLAMTAGRVVTRERLAVAQ